MLQGYRYEVRRGARKLVGHIHRVHPIQGSNLVVPAYSALKEPYNGRSKTMYFPVRSRLVRDNGVEFTYARYIDVSRKSQRQVDILLAGRTV